MTAYRELIERLEGGDEEKLLDAMRYAKVDGEADLTDFLSYSFEDAKSLGGYTEYPDRWHWYSDIRSDERGDAERLIIRPAAIALLRALEAQSKDKEEGE